MSAIDENFDNGNVKAKHGKNVDWKIIIVSHFYCTYAKIECDRKCCITVGADADRKLSSLNLIHMHKKTYQLESTLDVKIFSRSSRAHICEYVTR